MWIAIIILILSAVAMIIGAVGILYAMANGSMDSDTMLLIYIGVLGAIIFFNSNVIIINMQWSY